MRRLEQINEEGRLFDLDADDLALLNPNTHTCPVFRTAGDAALTKAIYRRVPLLFRENPKANPGGVRFLRMLDMANDSSLFHTAKELQIQGWKLDGNTFRRAEEAFLPLYEGKMFWLYNHRFGDYATKKPDYKKNDLPEVTADKLELPTFLPIPQFWVDCREVEDRLEGKWSHRWLLAWRDITGVETVRTCIASILPRVGVGHTSPLMLPYADSEQLACLYGMLCSFVFDYTARQKVGRLHLTFGVLEQLPVLSPSTFSHPCPWLRPEPLFAWLLPRVLELTYTAWDLKSFAEDCGYEGPPFRWDEERRFQLRCELDAAFFHLYLDSGEWQPAKDEPAADFARLKEAFPTPRHAVEYIMETFPLVRKADEEKHGIYRTKERIPELYDTMAKAECSSYR